MTYCAHCHLQLADSSRATWAGHCREAHPQLAEVAGRSDRWDHEGP